FNNRNSNLFVPLKGAIVEEQIVIYVTTEEFNYSSVVFIYSYFTNSSLMLAFFAFSSCLFSFLLTLYSPTLTRYVLFTQVDFFEVDAPFDNSFFTSARNVSIDFPCFENQ